MLSEYAKANNWLDINDYKDILFDEFGNRRSKPITEKYEKYADGKWHKDEAWRGGNIYVIDGKIYEKYNDSLMPLNMDFNSSSCHACWKLIEEITEFKRITGNKNLYYSPVLKITLHRQDYSNGTCFYSLIRDGEKYAAVDECGTLEKILEVLRRYNRIDDKYRMLPQINDIILARNEMIGYIKQMINKN